LGDQLTHQKQNGIIKLSTYSFLPHRYLKDIRERSKELTDLSKFQRLRSLNKSTSETADPKTNFLDYYKYGLNSRGNRSRQFGTFEKLNPKSSSFKLRKVSEMLNDFNCFQLKNFYLGFQRNLTAGISNGKSKNDLISNPYKNLKYVKLILRFSAKFSIVILIVAISQLTRKRWKNRSSSRWVNRWAGLKT